MHKGQLYGLGNAVLLDASVSVVVVAVDVEDVIDDEAVVFIVEDLACFLGVILVQREVKFWGSVFLSFVLEGYDFDVRGLKYTYIDTGFITKNILMRHTMLSFSHRDVLQLVLCLSISSESSIRLSAIAAHTHTGLR